MGKAPAGELLRIMSHELRTPLNGIIGFAQLLLRDKTLTQRQVMGISSILESGDQMLVLINALVDLARAEAGELELHRVEVPLRSWVAGVMHVVQPSAVRKGLAVTSEIAPDTPEAVRIDDGCLRRVLTNLLDNAVKFTDKGGVVLRVDGRRSGYLSFSVRDTGRGIAPSRLESIFLPFGRCTGDNSRVKDGGLGLAISREFVRLMGGELRVSSEPGSGSIFQFDIADR